MTIMSANKCCLLPMRRKYASSFTYLSESLLLVLLVAHNTKPKNLPENNNAKMKSQNAKLNYILEKDVKLTKKFVAYLLQFASFRSLQIHCKFLEISCDGIAWLVSWIAFTWLMSSKGLYQMQFNMLVGLILDIVVIAVIKAAVRRRRPVPAKDMLTIGPDKFSFPSGHASRAFYVLLFFTRLYALPIIFWMPLTAWAVSVTLSRLILQRHYILDVCAGAVLGILEALFLGLIWFSEETASGIIGFVSEDNVPGGPE